jgi:hypothetical protein
VRITSHPRMNSPSSAKFFKVKFEDVGVPDQAYLGRIVGERVMVKINIHNWLLKGIPKYGQACLNPKLVRLCLALSKGRFPLDISMIIY